MAKRPRQGPNLAARGGGKANNQSKQIQQSTTEGHGVREDETAKRQDKPGEMLLSVQENEPVVEEGPVEPDLQEVILIIRRYVSH